MINLAYRKVKEQTGSEYIAALAAMQIYKETYMSHISKCGCLTCKAEIENYNREMNRDREMERQYGDPNLGTGIFGE